MSEQDVELRRALSAAMLSRVITKDGNARSNLTELESNRERAERDVMYIAIGQRRPLMETIFQSGKAVTQSLQPNECLIEFVREYPDPTQPADGPPQYFAFILQRDREIALVPLGSAEEIDERVRAWREEIREETDQGQNAQWLREHVWQPLEQQLGPDAHYVYICPQGGLSALPWLALPGRKTDSVLLEDYALALVPYGGFLAQENDLGTAKRGEEATGQAPAGLRWLLVGNVDYSAGGSDAAPAAEGESPRLLWPALPATGDELKAVASLVSPQNAVRLEGAAATTDRVLQELETARWAHFATHGFFAGPEFQAALNFDDNLQAERHFIARRHPLMLTGIVLAGANQPPPRDASGLPLHDGGFLTGDIIAALPLDHLEMVVLSACETGLGHAADGEGTMGLQRAFHLAGAQNVIATLWRVDDQATAGLMRLFYHYYLEESLPPIDALRRAQLALRNNPRQAAELAALRAPDFRKAARQLDPNRPAARSQLSPRLWAGVVLSGRGQ
jgi:CHAT domain-containing protein